MPGHRFVDFFFSPFKEPAFGFIDFFLFLKISILFISSLIFISYFRLLTLGFVVLIFLILLGGRLDCLFGGFLIF